MNVVASSSQADSSTTTTGRLAPRLQRRLCPAYARRQRSSTSNPHPPLNQVLLEELPDVPCPGLPKPAHLARNANRLRQKLRPTEPRDLEFELELEHVPDNFFRNDVRVSKMNVNTISTYKTK